MTRLIESVTLEDNFVRLEPFRADHREPLRQAGDDPDLWRFHGLNQNNATFDRYFDHYLQETEAGRDLAFAVWGKGQSRYIGSSCYLAVVPTFKRLEIGSTWYAKDAQAGYANPACKRLLIGHALDTLGWNRVEFKLDQRNARSWAAMRKLGAVEEGIHREHMVLPDGHKRSSVWFSVLPSDWPRVKAGLNARLAAFA